jgi:hypothetical protein
MYQKTSNNINSKNASKTIAATAQPTAAAAKTTITTAKTTATTTSVTSHVVLFSLKQMYLARFLGLRADGFVKGDAQLGEFSACGFSTNN